MHVRPQVKPCHQLGWSSQALILSILALGAMPKQQQQQQQRQPCRFFPILWLAPFLSQSGQSNVQINKLSVFQCEHSWKSALISHGIRKIVQWASFRKRHGRSRKHLLQDNRLLSDPSSYFRLKVSKCMYFAPRRKMLKPSITPLPVALTDFHSRQFKTWMKKLATQVDFCLFLNAFLHRVQWGAWKSAQVCLIKVLLAYCQFI